MPGAVLLDEPGRARRPTRGEGDIDDAAGREWRAGSPCPHVESVRRLEPRSAECAECVVLAADWAGLLVCLSCGWVACSDDSPHQHARAHYEETDHPVATTYEPSSWRWCYVDARVV